MRKLIAQLRRLAPYLTLVTLEGEQGSGTTTAARALHYAGPASRGPFRPCLATHFFHADPTPGWSAQVLEEAHGGMLFLDRIQDLSAGQQTALTDFLHWLENGRELLSEPAILPAKTSFASEPDLQRLPRQIVLASIHPEQQLTYGGFFSQPAGLLSMIRLQMPPLRERREDIPLLAQIFLRRFAQTYGKTIRGLGPGTIGPLIRHSWPGNVRELEAVVDAAALRAEGSWIEPMDLPPLPEPSHPGSTVPTTYNGRLNTPQTEELCRELNLDRAIFEHVTRTLDRMRGNKLRAARLLGISRSTLYRILAGKPLV